jgi:hypothetical protein
LSNGEKGPPIHETLDLELEISLSNSGIFEFSIFKYINFVISKYSKSNFLNQSSNCFIGSAPPQRGFRFLEGA